MRQHDEDHALAVIDRTLAGEAVPVQDAELAELSLILAGERERPRAAFAAELDARVSRRFRPVASAGAPRPARAWRRWWLTSGSLAGAALAAVAVIVIAGTAGSGSHGPAGVGLTRTPASGAAAQTVTSSASAAGTASAPSTASASGTSSTASAGAGSTAAAGAGSSATAGAESTAGAGVAAPGPGPVAPGRSVIRGAQISLSTRPRDVETVAQEVFVVIGDEKGVVQSSTVTANGGATGYAQFQLSVPNANLGPAMAALSALHGASVVSRTDTSQDVTAQVGGAGRRLADDRARRTVLLRRLAVATTTAAIDSLQAQIGDANAAIARDENALSALQHQVASSQISLTINASMLPVARHSAGGGFTLGGAVHDAGRVLVVSAGVALVALAVLIPLVAMAAAIAWLALVVRRHRREQALDLM